MFLLSWDPGLASCSIHAEVDWSCCPTTWMPMEGASPTQPFLNQYKPPPLFPAQLSNQTSMATLSTVEVLPDCGALSPNNTPRSRAGGQDKTRHR
jgi:hypothetical protein